MFHQIIRIISLAKRAKKLEAEAIIMKCMRGQVVMDKEKKHKNMKTTEMMIKWMETIVQTKETCIFVKDYNCLH